MARPKKTESDSEENKLIEPKAEYKVTERGVIELSKDGECANINPNELEWWIDNGWSPR